MTTIVHRTILSKEKLQQIFALQQIWGNIRKARFHIKKQSDVIRNFYSKVRILIIRFSNNFKITDSLKY